MNHDGLRRTECLANKGLGAVFGLKDPFRRAFARLRGVAAGVCSAGVLGKVSLSQSNQMTFSIPSLQAASSTIARLDGRLNPVPNSVSTTAWGLPLSKALS